jgi:hypothetical protein
MYNILEFGGGCRGIKLLTNFQIRTGKKGSIVSGSSWKPRSIKIVLCDDGILDRMTAEYLKEQQ